MSLSDAARCRTFDSAIVHARNRGYLCESAKVSEKEDVNARKKEVSPKIDENTHFRKVSIGIYSHFSPSFPWV